MPWARQACHGSRSRVDQAGRQRRGPVPVARGDVADAGIGRVQARVQPAHEQAHPWAHDVGQGASPGGPHREQHVAGRVRVDLDLVDVEARRRPRRHAGGRRSRSRTTGQGSRRRGTPLVPRRPRRRRSAQPGCRPAGTGAGPPAHRARRRPGGGRTWRGPSRRPASVAANGSAARSAWTTGTSGATACVRRTMDHAASRATGRGPSAAAYQPGPAAEVDDRSVAGSLAEGARSGEVPWLPRRLVVGGTRPRRCRGSRGRARSEQAELLGPGGAGGDRLPDHTAARPVGADLQPLDGKGTAPRPAGRARRSIRLARAARPRPPATARPRSAASARGRRCAAPPRGVRSRSGRRGCAPAAHRQLPSRTRRRSLRMPPSQRSRSAASALLVVVHLGVREDQEPLVPKRLDHRVGHLRRLEQPLGQTVLPASPSAAKRSRSVFTPCGQRQDTRMPSSPWVIATHSASATAACLVTL